MRIEDRLATRIADGHAAGIVLECRRLIDIELDAVDLVRAGRNDFVEQLAEILDAAHGDSHLVADPVADEARRFARTIVVILRGNIEIARLDIVIRNPVVLNTLSTASLFCCRLAAAVSSCVTTPILTRAMSGFAKTSPIPVTVIDGCRSSAAATTVSTREKKMNREAQDRVRKVFVFLMTITRRVYLNPIIRIAGNKSMLHGR